MELTSPLKVLQEKVFELNQQDANLAVSDIAQRLDISEGEATLALPSELVTVFDGKHTELILQALPSWGKVTTIVHSAGSIFEAKAPFAKGKKAHGYYNLMGGKEGQLHGHLKIDLITDIAFVSKPFMGMESYFIGFYNKVGSCVFKVYLGRDRKRVLFPEQIAAFKAIQQELD